MSTDPAPSRPPIGRLMRLRTQEPVRLYLWPVAALLLVGATVAGIRAGGWWAVALAMFAVAVVIGAESARASVYSPAGAMAERVNAALNARLNR